MMVGLGKLLILLGGILVAVGLLLVTGPNIPMLGKLPGDLHFKWGSADFFVPLGTSILLSLVLSGILWIVQHLGKK